MIAVIVGPEPFRENLGLAFRNISGPHRNIEVLRTPDKADAAQHMKDWKRWRPDYLYIYQDFAHPNAWIDQVETYDEATVSWTGFHQTADANLALQGVQFIVLKPRPGFQPWWNTLSVSPHLSFKLRMFERYTNVEMIEVRAQATYSMRDLSYYFHCLKFDVPDVLELRDDL